MKIIRKFVIGRADWGLQVQFGMTGNPGVCVREKDYKNKKKGEILFLTVKEENTAEFRPDEFYNEISHKNKQNNPKKRNNYFFGTTVARE